MEDINHSISALIKSKQYYKEAYDWYAYKYLNPASQRLALSIFLMIMLSINYYLLDTISQFYDVEEDPKVVVYVKDGINQFPRLIELGDSAFNTNISVAEYFIKLYIARYESYEFNQFDNNIEFIKKYSTRSVLNHYYKNVQLSNLNSPINLYQKYTDVDVENIQVSFNLDQFGNANQAEVSFDLVINNRSDQPSTEKKAKKVIIDYFMTDVEQVMDKQKPLIFQVRDYKVLN